MVNLLKSDNVIIILVLLAVSMATIYFYKNSNIKLVIKNKKNNKKSRNNMNNLDKKRVRFALNKNTKHSYDGNKYTHELDNPNNRSYLERVNNQDTSRIINPLLPPERAFGEVYGIPINMPSRGHTGAFQQVGILYKDDIVVDESSTIGNTDPTVLPLYGRPVHSGSNMWSYYTATDKHQSMKLPLTVNGRKCDQSYGCKELYTGDLIDVPAYNNKFKVEIYGYDTPRYIPYIY